MVSPTQPHAEIRMTPIKTQDYIQIKLATFQYKIFASTSYLKEKGVPTTEKELDNHKIISYGEDAQPPLDKKRLNWLLWQGKENVSRVPCLEISSIYGLAKCVEAGLGIASLP
jgi:DNA-binding transcriptional LysR family regulator